MSRLFIGLVLALFSAPLAMASYDITTGGAPLQLLDDGKPLTEAKVVIHPILYKNEGSQWIDLHDIREFKPDSSGRIELPLMHFFSDDPAARFFDIIQVEVTYVPQLEGYRCSPASNYWALTGDSLDLLNHPITDAIDDRWMLDNLSLGICQPVGTTR